MKACDSCEHLSPCIDGAYDWDYCRVGHDISNQRRKTCHDQLQREDLMWDDIAKKVGGTDAH